MSSGKSLFLKTLVFALFIEVIVLILFYTLPESRISPSLPYLVPFFLSVSFLTNFYLIKIPADSPHKFIRAFMMITFLRLVFYSLVMVLYVLIYPADAVKFIIGYLILFFVFLIYDVWFLLTNKNR